MEQHMMDELLKKASVLVEALPYIQRFNRKIIVVKYGGSAMIDDQLKRSVIEDVTLLKLVGFKPIIVHGGGKEISRWVEKSGMEPKFVSGLRVTDEPTMEIAEMVLNKVNKSLVQLVEQLGVLAVGISGKDGGMLKAVKKYADGADIGFVGEVEKVNPKILYDLLEKDFLPIVAPIGMDSEGNTYNINADDAACAIARTVSAEKLAFLTDIEGVYKDPEDKSTLISELTISEADTLIGSGYIGGGMLPKLNNCIDAIKNGVSRVHILDGTVCCWKSLPIKESARRLSEIRRQNIIMAENRNKNMNEYMTEAEQIILHTYNRFPVVFERGDGVHLYNMQGKEYLDFAAGIGVMALGYNNAAYNEALKAQIDKLLHTSNLYYNTPIIEASKKALKASERTESTNGT